MKSVVRSFIFLLALATLMGALTAAFHPRAPSWSAARQDHGAISVQEALAKENLVWLDARSSDKFAQGHVAGAISLNEDDWNRGIDQVLSIWTGEESFVVYCEGGGCHASKAVAERLREELGLEEVFHLHNGWDALLEAGVVEQ